MSLWHKRAGHTHDRSSLVIPNYHSRIRGSIEKPQQPDYYQALLSNYNPGLTLSPAAKQIELDLLRTLPSNKHYDGPHATGRFFSF